MRRTILDFTGIYRNQETLRAEAQEYLDLSRMQGTDCYCDPETERSLKEMVEKMPRGGIHLMDSGNYHYVSKIFLEVYADEVSLVVLDHHTDMQPPALLPILSCGSWLADALKANQGIRQVFLIGPPLEALEQIPTEYRDRIAWISQEDLAGGNWREKLENFHAAYPVYLSVDKDVLAPQVCRTNWDQGIMQLDEMEEVIRWFACRGQIVGADICGEPELRQASARDLSQSTAVSRRMMNCMVCLDKQGKGG